jgi:hypothetical protein
MKRSSNPDTRRVIRVVTRITGTGAVVVNIFKILGPVRILEQIAEIMEVTTLTNLTNLYATAYDGTNTIDLSADGAVLTNAPVGTTFTKDLVIASPFSVQLSDEIRVSEVSVDRTAGKPFTITPKNGVDNFIQLRLTTTDAPVDFMLFVKFIYEPVNGGSLELLV